MRIGRIAAVLIPMMLVALPAIARTYRATVPDRGDRRLFRRFIEDAAIIPGGWIEGQFVYQNLPDQQSRYFLGPLIAFRLVDNLEAGLRFGFVDFEDDRGPDGSGFSDIDIYAKYRLRGGAGRVAIGGVLKIPTADEEDRIGTGSTDLEAFVAWRRDFDAVTVTANFGLRHNGNPDPPLPSGDDSYLFGGAILLPVSAGLTFVIESSYESQRVEGGEDDARLTVGFQTTVRSGAGGFRGAVDLPLSDGAPDAQIFFGAYFTY